MKHRPDRREFLAQCAAAYAVSGLPSRLRAATPSIRARAPIARVEPVVEDLFGIRVVDHYRWMENAEDPDWLPFLRGQNARTRSVLDALPGRRALGRRISRLSSQTAVTRTVHAAGHRLFYEQRPMAADQYQIFLREAGRPDRVLIDPTTMRGGGAHVSIDWWTPSFDGRHVVYGLSPAGSEASVLHVLDVDSGAVLPERVEKTDYANPAWLPDGSGFFYTQLTGERGTPTLYQHSVVKLHRLGQDAAGDAVVLRSGRDPAVPIEPLQFARIVTAPDAAHALALVFDIRTEFAFYVATVDAVTAGRAQWRRVADFDALITDVALAGERLFLVSQRDTVRGQVLRLPVEVPELARAKVSMPQGEAVIEKLAAARDGIYVSLMDGGVHRLARFGREEAVTTLDLPFEGAVKGVFTAADQDGAYLSLVGWLQPPVSGASTPTVASRTRA